MKFLIGLLFIASGIAMMHYRYKIYDFTGEWWWAQEYIGGTTNAIVLIWMILIGIWVAYPFWVIDFSSTPETNKTFSVIQK